MSDSNKKIAKQAQEILKSQGHDVSLGHMYELLSKLSGFSSHNVAKSLGVEFAVVLPGPEQKEIAETVVNGSGDLFDVKIKTSYDGEVTKFYRINADSEAQARQIIEEYLEFAHGNKDSDKEKPAFPQVVTLIKSELDTGGFQYADWEMIDSVPYEAKVETVYPVDKKTAEHVRRMQQYNQEFKNLNASQIADKVQSTIAGIKD